MRPNVTLITPLRNERENVRQLWQTIHEQSFPPQEWVITDNGSDDGTYEWLVERQSSGHFPICILRLPGLTIAQMLNAAIRRAKYDVIACCHGGTQIPTQWLENLLRPLFQDEAVEVAAGVWKAVGETETERWVARHMMFDLKSIDENRYLPASRSLAFRRSAWSRVGGFPEWLPKFGEDTLFAIRLRMAGCRFAVVRDALVGWRPKATIWSVMRQHRYYAEADGLMGFQPYSFLRIGAKLGIIVLVPMITALLLDSEWLAAVVFTVLIVVGYLRAGRTSGWGILSYLFWSWLLPLSVFVGWAEGLRQRWLGGISVPKKDQEAIRRYHAG